MAEFKVIMTGWKDICKRHVGCIDCPVKACDGWGDLIMEVDEKTIKSIEDTVLPEIPFWVNHDGHEPSRSYYTCSVCGGVSNIKRNYCPDCGRKLLLG